MALPRWQATIVDDAGDILPSAEVTVIVESTGLAASLFSDRAGSTAKGASGVFSADTNGFAFFYADPGAYRITAEASGGGTSVTWRYVSLFDFDANVGTAAGEVPLNSDLGTASTKDTGTAAGEVPLSPATTTITASATFTQSTNNIALVGLGSIGLEIGDVIEVTGTDDNDKLFTVEVITDADNVIVNQAHAGGTTTKSLVDETVSATVTLVAKWFNASLGLGQGWLLVTASRASGTTYTNSTNRALMVSEYNGGDTSANLTIDGIRVEFSTDFATGNNSSVQGVVPINGEYSITLTIPGDIDEWAELR